MESLVKDIQSLSWWIGVIIVGTITSVVSSYLKNILDNILNKCSRWWNTRTEYKRIRRKEKIEKLQSDHHEQYRFAFEDLRIRFRSMTMIIVGSIFFPLALILKENNLSIIYIIVAIMGIFLVMFGVKDYFNATEIRSLILEALSNDKNN